MSFPSTPDPRRVPVLTISMLLLFLAIEFLDELVFGVREAAWPVIRSDLQLDYLQIGVLLSVPAFGSNIIEPFIGVVSDYWRRWVIIIGGGVCFAIALATISLSASYRVLLAGLILLYPASGAFVSLSQAALMDADPMRREQNMARWTFAGSLGVVAGPLVLNLAMLGKIGWQGIFALLASVALLVAIATWRMRFNTKSGFDDRPGGEPFNWRIGLAGLGRAITNRPAWRWLILLQFSDLMLDVFLGFLALYFVDVVGSSPAQASIAVAVWAGVGLVGDFLLIPLLEKVAGLTYLRISSVCVLILFPLFLLLPGLQGKLVLLGLLGLFNAGWYAILQAQLYRSLPGQSGVALALNNVAGVMGSLLPLALGWAARTYGLGVAIWALLLGPIALAVGLFRWRVVDLGEE